MNPRSRVYIAVAVALALGVGAGFAAHDLTANSNAAPVTTTIISSQPASSTSATGQSLAQIYAADAPAVVDIVVTLKSGSSNSFGFPVPSSKAQAEGTGFEIDANGDIMTAEHVVDGATDITVQFQDGSTAKATLVGKDSSTDTAVIHVNVPSSQLHPLSLGDSSTMQPGDELVAIGSPFSLQETMTAGIVSAVNRSITAPNNFTIQGAIQTDAAINHGNSGGPVIDVATNTVIGIADQILNEGDTQDNAGVAFAVPINASKAVAHTLIAGGTVHHAYLGVRIGDATGGGAIVGKVVPGSPSAKAGLKQGDVIKSWNGKNVLNASALTSDVIQSQVGQKIELTVDRAGKTLHLTVTLGDQPTSLR